MGGPEMSDARTCIEKLLSASILQPVSLIRAFRHTVHCSFLSLSLSLSFLFIYRVSWVRLRKFWCKEKSFCEDTCILPPVLFLSLSLSLFLSGRKSIVSPEIDKLDKHNPRYTSGRLHNKFNLIFISCGTRNAFASCDSYGEWESFIAVMYTRNSFRIKYQFVSDKFFDCGYQHLRSFC